MRTSKEILTDLAERVEHADERKILVNILKYCDNPQGALPGDKMAFWDNNKGVAEICELRHYKDPSKTDYPWIDDDDTCWKNAELVGHAGLTSQQKDVLIKIDKHLGENCTSLRSRLSEAFDL